MTMDFDDRAWDAQTGILAGPIVARRRFTVSDPAGAKLRIRLQTVRPARTQVYLNGTLVVDAVRGQRGGYANIELDPSVFQLLRSGENVLAIVCDKKGSENNKVDAGLEINRVDIEQRMLPPIHAEAVYINDRPEGDETLRVRETKDKFQAALQESYNQKSIPALLKDLEDELPYNRYLAVQALLAKGQPGITAAFGLAEHKDWQVRSAVVGIVLQAGKSRKAKLDDEQLSLFKAQIPALTRLVGDEHFWVRTRAADALAMLGADAAVALPELVNRVQDQSEWVRASVIRAVQTLGTDPMVVVKAAEQSLMIPSSAFEGANAAVAILKKNAGTDESRLAALLQLLRTPPEGGGGALLGEVMAMAVELDPAGTKLIPVLIDAAGGKTAFGRFRGNPRGKAIETLGQYGPKASAAVPVLQTILAGTDAKEKPLREAARLALEEIGVPAGGSGVP
jgi:HEAT repeat protein